MRSASSSPCLQTRAVELSSKLVQYNRHSRSLNSKVRIAELPSCTTELSLHVGLLTLGRIPQLLSRQTCRSSSQSLRKATEHPTSETRNDADTCETICRLSLEPRWTKRPPPRAGSCSFSRFASSHWESREKEHSKLRGRACPILCLVAQGAH